MKLNQIKSDLDLNIVNDRETINHAKNKDNIKYLYPNGHRLAPQMRWFKGSRDRGFRNDIVA
tara:strand:- start:185 stop:370 length:186 start_codon:yes stop_codon:yes gene_type:complete